MAKLREAEYVIYEAPQTASETGPDTPEPTPEEPASENRTLENPTLQNTKRTNYLKTNPPISPPQGDGSVSRKKREPKRPRLEAGAVCRFWEFLSPGGGPSRQPFGSGTSYNRMMFFSGRWPLGWPGICSLQDCRRGIGIPYACGGSSTGVGRMSTGPRPRSPSRSRSRLCRRGRIGYDGETRNLRTLGCTTGRDRFSAAGCRQVCGGGFPSHQGGSNTPGNNTLICRSETVVPRGASH